jgi:hypothetical protein
MRHRYVVLACTVVGVVAALLYWQRKVRAQSAAVVAPYTAHLTRTVKRVMPDGSSVNAVSTVVRARDRRGRSYEKFGGGSVFVEDPGRLRTLQWGSHNQVAILGLWPYWSGRKGCWADERGQHQSSFPSDEDWHKVPTSPGDGKLVTVATMAVSVDRRVKARFVWENLGHKEMHGLNAFGMGSSWTSLESLRPSDLQESTTELWKSSELDLKLLEVTSGPKYGSDREELTDLQRGDPDPALFEPPQGYKVETIEYHPVPCERQ